MAPYQGMQTDHVVSAEVALDHPVGQRTLDSALGIYGIRDSGRGISTGACSGIFQAESRDVVSSPEEASEKTYPGFEAPSARARDAC